MGRSAIVTTTRIAALGLWLLLLPFMGVAQAGEVNRGAVLANACAACHGPDGVSPGAIPSIAGKPVGYIEQALKAFRSGERPATVMDRHARGYTDEEIRLIAEYFANQ